MARRNTATLILSGSIGAPQEDIVILTMSAPSFVAGDYYAPVGYNPPAKTAAAISAGGLAWVAARNFTLTQWYVSSHSNADSANEKWHIYKNGVDTTLFIQVPNGAKVNNATGLSLSIVAGDEICLLYDALADGSEGLTSMSLQLSPA